MKRLIASTRPAVIFHAAAYKHVPMMEEHPSEGVQVNVGGTMAVLVRRDRGGRPAVRPRLDRQGRRAVVASWAPPSASRSGWSRTRPRRPAATTSRSGSATSWARPAASLPIFQSQLENGEAITVTHPEMTRYFMTMQEAGWLILDAAAIGRAGRPLRPRHGRARPDPRHGPRPDPPDRPRREQRADPVHRPASRREAPRAALLRDRAGREDRRSTRSSASPTRCRPRTSWRARGGSSSSRSATATTSSDRRCSTSSATGRRSSSDRCRWAQGMSSRSGRGSLPTSMWRRPLWATEQPEARATS